MITNQFMFGSSTGKCSDSDKEVCCCTVLPASTLVLACAISSAALQTQIPALGYLTLACLMPTGVVGSFKCAQFCGYCEGGFFQKREGEVAPLIVDQPKSRSTV